MSYSFEYICDFNDDFEHQRHLTTFSSAFRRLCKRKGLDSSKEQTKKQIESKGE